MLDLLREIFIGFVTLITSVLMVITGTSISDTSNTPTSIDTQKATSSQEVSVEPKETNETSKEEVLGSKTEKLVEMEPDVVIPIEIIKEDEETITINPGVIDTNLIDLIVTIPPIEETPLGVSDVNQTTRESLVNIICISRQGGLLQPITGSGVIIDSRGVILTNAHIAQYYLLKDFITEDYLECTIRTGSPAMNSYKAKLLYISPSWVGANYQKISQQNPKGTGEDDFALLLINESVNEGVPLPTSFPHVSPDLREMKPETGESVIVAGYPAGFLGGSSIQKELYAVSTVTQIMDIFTFKENTLDLFSIGGNIAAQKGSSGGAIVNFLGRLSGIVVTASDALQTEDRDLRAITLSHINRSIEKDTGTNLNNYLFGNLSQKANQFNEVFSPGLTFLLQEALGQ